jgi:Tfp pilus assembly protein PilX
VSATARRGFALVAALLTLMLIAALVASVFFAAMEETSIGASSAAKELALVTAESAIESRLAAGLDAGAPIGVAGAHSSTVNGFGMPVNVTVTRLDSTIYWIVAEAGSLSSQSTAARRIGVIVGVRVASDHSITIDRSHERWWWELF